MKKKFKRSKKKEKQIKPIENRVKKTFLDTDQKSIVPLFPKDFLKEPIYELNKIVDMENKLNRYYLIYKTGNKKKEKAHDFEKLETITSFGREVYNNDLSLGDPLELQIRSKGDIDILKESTKTKESLRK